MKLFMKSTLPLLAIATAMFFASCSNPVAKNIYKCDEEEMITMEFQKDYSVILAVNLPLARRNGDDKAEFAPRKILIASGTYRVENKFLTVTIGSKRDNAKDAFEIKDATEWPETVTSIIDAVQVGHVYTFQIQDDGKLISNVDARTWSKK